ncbi:esterase/lipase family protein [Streptomyces sp. Agncl-13]|uniref:esterase/lipase family protein n=1 Tax=Streptomyces sp. Agncl-13 TaxID=3400628 RepID=UPI003A8C2B13
MSARPGFSSDIPRPYATHDAVVVIPGIMGSVLVDRDAPQKPVWGDGPVAASWFSGAALRRLRLTEEEQEGHYGRIVPGGLLRYAAWFPGFRGIERYRDLVRGVHGAVAHEKAVLEFPYDWRLPVAHNARLLAEAALIHLEQWRAHDAHDAAMRQQPSQPQDPAQLVLVAHSMGGLLARRVSLDPDVQPLVRTCVTLGSPFHGTPKAAVLLNSGRGLPFLPARRPASALLRPDPDDGLRALAVTLPGVYDLLPQYRCLDEGGSGRRLTAADVVRLGGDPVQAAAWQERQVPNPPALAGDHQLLLGTAQRTAQSLRIDDGVVTPLFTTLRGTTEEPRRENEWGDGTVPSCSAEVPGVRPVGRLFQSHSDLGRADEVVRWVVRILRDGDLGTGGPPLGTDTGRIGLDTPDGVVVPHQTWTAVVTGAEVRPGAFCTVESVDTRRRWADRVRLQPRDGELHAPVTLDSPGLYRVTFQPPGGAPVSQLVFATGPEHDD